MGFVSPATDYVEPRLDLNEIFTPNPANTFMIETSDGCVLIDRVARIGPGDLVLFQMEGYPMMGKWYPAAMVTEDGESIEGEALENVIVLGKVTVQVLTLSNSFRPTI